MSVGPGTRVFLAHPSPLVKLSSPFGTIVREDEYGYWIVALDLPCICEGDEVQEILESLDNMQVVV